MGVPPNLMVYMGKSQTKMDDLGAPLFQEPPTGFGFFDAFWKFG